jgi:predicted RNase H-like HicB family nuclease
VIEIKVRIQNAVSWEAAGEPFLQQKYEQSRTSERTTASISMRQVVIYPDREDGGWVAEVPSLPGCITQGRTRAEVLANARDAIQTWIDGARQVGMTA